MATIDIEIERDFCTSVSHRPVKMRGSSVAGLLVPLTLCLGMSGSQPDGGEGGDLDWASGCRERNGCECKWVHGKRTATCPPGLGLDALPEFPAPDRIQVSVVAGIQGCS